MKKVQKILVPTDFSEAAMHAYRYALWLGDRFEAQLKLIHLIPPEVVPMDLPVMSAKLTQQRSEAAKEVMKTFVDAGLVQVQTAHDIEHVPDVHTEVIIGMAMDLITDVADQDDTDLIVMGTRGERNAVTNWFGTTSSNTVRRARCPVLVIPEEAPFERISNIAYATDLTETDPLHIWEVGTLFAQFEPRIKVIHVREPGDEVKPLQMDDLKRFFEDRSPSYPISFHELKDDDDDTEDQIEDFVEDHDIDLLIMFKPRRNFLENIFHRSLTNETSLHTEVPLLVLK